ncbi:hypothetical protein Pmani_014829 [Petrolisthes manimaculis]|nr:hypothetical protein Pmani_014829 [Petrolisthes manimaculis]
MHGDVDHLACIWETPRPAICSGSSGWPKTPPPLHLGSSLRAAFSGGYRSRSQRFASIKHRHTFQQKWTSPDYPPTAVTLEHMESTRSHLTSTPGISITFSDNDYARILAEFPDIMTRQFTTDNPKHGVKHHIWRDME